MLDQPRIPNRVPSASALLCSLLSSCRASGQGRRGGAGGVQTGGGLKRVRSTSRAPPSIRRLHAQCLGSAKLKVRCVENPQWSRGAARGFDAMAKSLTNCPSSVVTHGDWRALQTRHARTRCRRSPAALGCFRQQIPRAPRLRRVAGYLNHNVGGVFDELLLAIARKHAGRSHDLNAHRARRICGRGVHCRRRHAVDVSAGVVQVRRAGRWNALGAQQRVAKLLGELTIAARGEQVGGGVHVDHRHAASEPVARRRGLAAGVLCAVVVAAPPARTKHREARIESPNITDVLTVGTVATRRRATGVQIQYRRRTPVNVV